MCYLQSILSVTVRQIRFFCIYVFVNLYPGFTKELFNFYSEDIFPPRGKKLNHIYYGVRCQHMRSLKLRTKFTMDTWSEVQTQLTISE